MGSRLRPRLTLCMDYKKHYNALIEKRKTNTPCGYVERHHVVPRCVGGDDDQSNIVALTAREHFLAHMLLWKMYPDKRGLVYAASMMANRFGRNKSTSRVYAALRESLALQQSEFRKDKDCYFQTKEYKRKVSKSVSKAWSDDDSVFNSDEYRKSLSDAQHLRWSNEKARAERSKMSKQIWRNKEMRKSISEKIRASTRTDEYREMQRQSRLGYKRSKANIQKTSGDRNGNSKLDKGSVITIRELRDGKGMSLKSISEIFGVSITNVSDIVNRKTWQHV